MNWTLLWTAAMECVRRGRIVASEVEKMKRAEKKKRKEKDNKKNWKELRKKQAAN